jgi:hypothetical protein
MNIKTCVGWVHKETDEQLINMTRLNDSCIFYYPLEIYDESTVRQSAVVHIMHPYTSRLVLYPKYKMPDDAHDHT